MLGGGCHGSAVIARARAASPAGLPPGATASPGRRLFMSVGASTLASQGFWIRRLRRSHLSASLAILLGSPHRTAARRILKGCRRPQTFYWQRFSTGGQKSPGKDRGGGCRHSGRMTTDPAGRSEAFHHAGSQPNPMNRKTRQIRRRHRFHRPRPLFSRFLGFLVRPRSRIESCANGHRC